MEHDAASIGKCMYETMVHNQGTKSWVPCHRDKAKKITPVLIILSSCTLTKANIAFDLELQTVLLYIKARHLTERDFVGTNEYTYLWYRIGTPIASQIWATKPLLQNNQEN